MNKYEILIIDGSDTEFIVPAFDENNAYELAHAYEPYVKSAIIYNGDTFIEKIV